MCRWVAYSGSPILLKVALYAGPNSPVGQSLHSRLGAEPTNGDGFGVGWWLFMHNGYINEFDTIKRDLVLAVDPALYPHMRSRTLFYTTDVPTLREVYPERELFESLSDDARLIVSEPLGDAAGVWNEVTESSWGVVGPSGSEIHTFRPVAPRATMAVGS